jgi:hypothetical protein
MKRYLVTLVTFGLLVGSALPALAADGKGKRRPGGKGRDGFASPQAMMMQLLRRYDANKNGRLDGDEQRTLLVAADKNLDGRLSPQEMLAAAQGGGEGRKEGVRKKDK